MTTDIDMMEALHALAAEKRRGPSRRIVGLEIDWTSVESLFDRVGLAPQVPAASSGGRRWHHRNGALSLARAIRRRRRPARRRRARWAPWRGR